MEMAAVGHERPIQACPQRVRRAACSGQPYSSLRSTASSTKRSPLKRADIEVMIAGLHAITPAAQRVNRMIELLEVPLPSDGEIDNDPIAWQLMGGNLAGNRASDASRVQAAGLSRWAARNSEGQVVMTSFRVLVEQCDGSAPVIVESEGLISKLADWLA
jgi:hypothetical protein